MRSSEETVATDSTTRDTDIVVLADGQATLHRGDWFEVGPTLPEKSVQCVVTSPPYFALRSYLPAGHPDKDREIGSEPTPDAFIATMVAVFREVRRVLRDDGALWLNLGDSFGQASCGGGSPVDVRKPEYGRKGYLKDKAEGRATDKARRDESNIRGDWPGQLQNIPHRVAEALRADGWCWRQTIAWVKRSPMPESVRGWRWERCRVKVSDGPRTEGQWNQRGGISEHRAPEWRDCPGCPKCEATGGYVLRRGKGRCTSAHEYVFLLTKGGDYFWDSWASREKAKYPNDDRKARSRDGQKGLPTDIINGVRQGSFVSSHRNPRNVWTLSSEPTSEHHFATFPSELVRRCLVAGVSAGGCCPQCGASFAPVMDSERVPTRPATNAKASDCTDDKANLDPERHVAITECLGYRPTCGCGCTEPARSTVLDPFSGLATVAQTARQLGHNAIGIELNPEYHALACKRALEPPRWWIRKHGPVEKPSTEPLPLFMGEQG